MQDKSLRKYISSLFNKKYQQTTTNNNAVNGFEATCIWPVNPHAFSEADFTVNELFNCGKLDAESLQANGSEKNKHSDEP